MYIYIYIYVARLCPKLPAANNSADVPLCRTTKSEKINEEEQRREPCTHASLLNSE